MCIRDSDTDEDMVQALVRLGAEPTLRAGIADHNRTAPCQVDWTCVMERTEAAYAWATERSTAPEPLVEVS